MFTDRELKLLQGVLGMAGDEARDGFGDAHRDPEEEGTVEELDTMYAKVQLMRKRHTWEHYRLAADLPHANARK